MSALMTAGEEKSLAMQGQDGEIAQAKVSEKIDELWPALVHHIGTDYYDNSLEVYFDYECESPIATMTQDQAEKIQAMGFGRCWLNFLDSTQQFIELAPKITIWERKKVSNPRWDGAAKCSMEGMA